MIMKRFILATYLICLILSTQFVESVAIPPRIFAHCGYVGGRIYCYGGDSTEKNSPAYTGLYSLDVNRLVGQPTAFLQDKWESVLPKEPFDTESRRFATFIVLPDKERFLIQGGYNFNNTRYVNQTIVYGTTTNTWTVALPYTEVNRGIRQIYLATAVNLPNKLVGFYGGSEQLANINVTQTTITGEIMPYYSDGGASVGFGTMQLYSPDAKSWAPFNPQFNPPPNFYTNWQSATLDPFSGKVYYLGGFFNTPTEESRHDPYHWTYTFNTNSGVWLNETFSGVIPSFRVGHTAHLMPNSRDIILYGGLSGTVGGKAVVDYFYTLNLTDNTWTEQMSVEVPIKYSGPRGYHSSVLVNNTLFIFFGRGLTGELQSSILSFDVGNIMNISYAPTFYEPVEIVTPSTNNDTKQQTFPPSILSRAAIGGITAGAVIIILVIIAGIIYLMRKKKRLNEEIYVDWDKIDEEYREVSKSDNSPHSANSASHVKGENLAHELIAPINTTADVFIVKPSISNDILLKPDASASYNDTIKPDAAIFEKSFVKPDVSASYKSLSKPNDI